MDESNIKLYLAPMEELTGYVFRNTINKYFGHIDKFYTPFISPDNRIMKTRAAREILPANNEGLYVIPQLLTNDPALFNEAAALISDMGHEEININFGCPSNTVTSKYKGSGILRAPDIMDRFLDGVFNGGDSILRKHPGFRISIKTRVGFNDTSDLTEAMKVLNRYPFSEMIVHPRLKKDIYSGSLRMEMFDQAVESCCTKISYNGDVRTVSDHDRIAERYKGKITGIMIGRAAIANPGIFRQIRTGKKTTKAELYDFLRELYEIYKADFSRENALAKLKEVWSYTVCLIEDEKDRSRIHKSILKANSEASYLDAVTVARGYIRDSI
ncbi:MAG: tRNA-dihydrouridine synthase family protein [Lachnospiraceae bacterium]|nr:tRNA-dihydrouridine synthase family protein [Lachnospiraceae bacterium]